MEREPIWESGAVPPAGSRGKAPGQGVEAPEVEEVSIFSRYKQSPMHIKYQTQTNTTSLFSTNMAISETATVK